MSDTHLCRRTRSGHGRSRGGEIVAALPDGLARLEIVEGAGYFTWKDAPDRYSPLLKDVLAAALVDD